MKDYTVYYKAPAWSGCHVFTLKAKDAQEAMKRFDSRYGGNLMYPVYAIHNDCTAVGAMPTDAFNSMCNGVLFEDVKHLYVKKEVA